MVTPEILSEQEQVYNRVTHLHGGIALFKRFKCGKMGHVECIKCDECGHIFHLVEDPIII